MGRPLLFISAALVECSTFGEARVTLLSDWAVRAPYRYTTVLLE